MSIKICISPSSQDHNECAVGDVEQNHMRAIGEKLNLLLSNDSRFEPYLLPILEGDEYSRLYQAVKQSNDLGVDYHLCLHSDGGYEGSGASGRYMSTGGLNFGKPIFDAMCELTPWSDMSLQQTNGLYELRNTNAVAFLLEVSFHDNAEQAAWIHNNADSIAETIYKGICKGCNLAYEGKTDWEIKYDDLRNQYYRFRQGIIDLTNLYL